jgi:hypothetical protein
VSVGAARPRGHRGGEGGRRWEPLVLVVAEVGKEGIGGPPLTASASPCHRLAKPSDRHAAAYRADCRLAKTREKREERGPNERREKREDPTRG